MLSDTALPLPTRGALSLGHSDAEGFQTQALPSLSPLPPSAQLGFLIIVCLKEVIRLGRGRGRNGGK